MNEILAFGKKIIIFSGFSLFYAPTYSLAQNANAEKSPLSPLYECAKITDNNKRLECYDNNVALISQSEAKNEIIALDTPKMNKIKSEAFGFKMPSLPKILAHKIEKPNSVKESQTLNVTHIGRNGGKPAIFTDNGQIWQISDEEEISTSGNPPWEVNIESASFGSYLMSIKGSKKGYRVKRVE